jgi:hypothetical protein
LIADADYESASDDLEPQAINQHRLQLSFFLGRAGLAKNR